MRIRVLSSNFLLMVLYKYWLYILLDPGPDIEKFMSLVEIFDEILVGHPELSVILGAHLFQQ